MESWKPIHGCEESHEVSDEGRVYSLKRKIVLQPGTHPKFGYKTVVLTKDGVRRPFGVHRLVAEAFLGHSAALVRHLDGDPGNNRLSNLAYGTATENNVDTVEHGRHRNANRTHCHQGHEYTPANTRIVLVNGRERRRCRECVRMHSKQYREKAKR